MLLEDQDRSRWDRAEIDEGRALLDRALRAGPRRARTRSRRRSPRSTTPRPDAGATDWREIAALYGRLATLAPSPVVELNRAVAIAMADGPAAGLALLDALAGDDRLDGIPVLPRGPRRPAAPPRPDRVGGRDAYRAALELTTNEVERAFLARRARARWRRAPPAPN